MIVEIKSNGECKPTPSKFSLLNVYLNLRDCSSQSYSTPSFLFLHALLSFPNASDMARFAAFFSLSVLLASLPSALAGPACARRHFKQADCVARCKSRWGWTGAMMNTDPWGSVVQKTDTDANWDAAIASACGFTASYVPFSNFVSGVAFDSSMNDQSVCHWCCS